MYIDILNILATFFVLELHSSQAFFSKNASPWIYQQTKIIQVLFIPAVLLFFMISGAMLLEYRNRQSTQLFFKKRFQRVVVPLVAWSILWYIFDVFWTANPGPMQHKNPSLLDFINGLLNNNINNIFWFFYIIIALYVATPILSYLAVNKKYDLLFYIVLVYFVVNSILIYFNQIFNLKINLMNVNQPLLTSTYVGYFIMGYLIHKNYFNRNTENLIMLSGLLALGIALVMAIIHPQLKTTSTTGLIVFLYSVALFIGIKRIINRITFSEKTIKLFSTVSAANLGVYLMHPLFIKILDKLLAINENSLIHIYLYPFLIYFICVFLTIILKKVPVLKNIFP